MILTTWCILKFNQKGKVSKYSKRILPINKIECDSCKTIWEESSKYEFRFEKWNGHFCKKCLKILSIERLVEAGTAALNKLTPEQRKINASIGGIACQKSENRDHYSFTTGRWKNMSQDERNKQVKRANNGLIEKLKDETYRKEHFAKVFKNSKIGYISKGQQELYEQCLEFGEFILDGIISNMKVDIISFDKKIAIEYNGDYYHCNPKSWNEEDFNDSIKMSAGEKWTSDRNRRFALQRLGFRVIVIWESDWKIDKLKCLGKIKQIYNEIN